MKWPSSRNDDLVARPEVLDAPRRPDEETPVVGEAFDHRIGGEVWACRLAGGFIIGFMRHPCRRARSRLPGQEAMQNKNALLP
jgi:hypothetical protein